MEYAQLILLLTTVTLLLLNLINKTKPENKPYVLMSGGEILESEMKKSGASLDFLLSSARLAGYFNLGDVDTAILEKNGKISFLPKSGRRPLNPDDFNFSPVREGVPEIIVRNGVIVEENLKKLQPNRADIMKIILSRDRKLESIVLATVCDSGRVDVFEKQSHRI